MNAVVRVVRCSRIPRRLVIAAAAAAVVVLAACAADSPGGAPSSGAQVFQQRCAACHGADLRGTPVGPSLLSELFGPGRVDDDAFRAAIAEGVVPVDGSGPPMPAVRGLSDAQVDAVIDHIRLVQAREGLEAPAVAAP